MTGEALDQLYRGAGLVAVPSEWQENCPLVVLEAFAWGKPVLGTQLGGLLELVGERELGELLPAADVAAWTAAITAWMGDPARRLEVGARAREVALEEHAPQLHFDRIESIYEDLGVPRRAGALK